MNHEKNDQFYLLTIHVANVALQNIYTEIFSNYCERRKCGGGFFSLSQFFLCAWRMCMFANHFGHLVIAKFFGERFHIAFKLRKTVRQCTSPGCYMCVW